MFTVDNCHDPDDEVIDPVSSGPGSSDKYKQGDSENEEEGEEGEDIDEDEIILDDSEEEPEQRPTKKKKGKAAKVPVQSEITSQRSVPMIMALINNVQGKRKADPVEKYMT